VEVKLVPPLHLRRAGARPDRGDVLAGVHLVVGRQVAPEGDLAHRTGDRTAEGGEFGCQGDGAERRAHARLLSPGDPSDVVQGKDRLLPAWPQEEVGGRWRGRMNLVADLLEDRRGALRGEDAGGDDVLLGNA